MPNVVRLSLYELENGFVGGKVSAVDSGSAVGPLFKVEPGKYTKEQILSKMEEYCDKRNLNIRQYSDDGVIN